MSMKNSPGSCSVVRTSRLWKSDPYGTLTESNVLMSEQGSCSDRVMLDDDGTSPTSDPFGSHVLFPALASVDRAPKGA